MKKITLFFILFSAICNAQTTFDFQNTDQGSSITNVVTETIDGITLTLSDADNGFVIAYLDQTDITAAGYNPSTAQGTTTITATFSEPVDLNNISMFFIDRSTSQPAARNATLTPTGRSNTTITASFVFGTPVSVNWANITSFTITTAAMEYPVLQEITINETLSTIEYNKPIIEVYPNPVVETLNIKNLNQSSKILVYNILGNLVKQAVNTNTVSFKELNSGLYLVKIVLENGNTINKKVIKN